MTTLLQGIAKGNFLVFGRAGMDIYATPIGVKSEVAQNFAADLGGSAANICTGLCKLGVNSALLTSVSDDAVGRFALNKLRKYGVDTRYVRSVAGEYRTSLAVYESCTDDFQNVIYRNGAADFQVLAKDVQRPDYTQYDAIVVTGTAFALQPSRRAMFAAFDRAYTANVPIILDIDYRPYSWSSARDAATVLSKAAALSDCIVGNEEEFGFMAGNMQQGLDKACALAEQSDRLVVYKMGSAGAVTLDGSTRIHTGIYPVTAVKPNGAGDAFMAGMLVALGAGYTVREAVLRGSACAAIVVSQPGCAAAMPNRKTLTRFLQKHPGPVHMERS